MTEVGDPEWERAMAALRRFALVRGGARVPLRAVAAGVAVGQWAAARRADYWTGGLTAGRVAALEAVPGWDWDGPSRRRWEIGLARLRLYCEEHGAATAPPDAVVGRFRVGEWARTQRAAHAAGRLPSPLVARLAALPGWVWTGEDDRWERGLQAARSHIAVHGTVVAPPDAQDDGFRVDLWVRRCQQDRREGALTAAQVDALEALPGWRWSTQRPHYRGHPEALSPRTRWPTASG